MAAVTVQFSGPIRRPWSDPSRQVSIAPQWTVADLLISLGFAEGELSYLYTAIDGKSTGLATLLEEGTTIDVSLRVGGG